MGARGLAGPEDMDRLWLRGLLPADRLLKGLEEVRSLAEPLLPLRRPLEAPGPLLGWSGATSLGDFRPITGLEQA